MATSVQPTPGGEAPVIAVPAAPEGSVVETAEQRRARAMEVATRLEVPGSPAAPPLSPEAAAAAIQAANRAAEAPDPLAAAAPAAPVESAEDREARLAAMSPEDRAATEAAEAAAAPVGVDPGIVAQPIVVAIPVPGSETPFDLEVGDQETADRISALVESAARADRVAAMREEAIRARDETEEFHLAVEMDPSGVITQAITDPADIEHLFRYLATRPGVLDRNADWLSKLTDGTKDLGTEAELAELERMKRREAVTVQVEEKREMRQYNRDLNQAINRSIASLAPDALTDKARELLFADVERDVRAFKQANNFKKMDLRRVPGFIQHRFSLMGITPKQNPGSEKARSAAIAAPAAAAPVAAAPARPVVPVPAKTAADLKAASAARQGASSASPGPGGVVTAMPTPPPFDPSQPGTAVSQRASWAKRVLVPFLAKKPV